MTSRDSAEVTGRHRTVIEQLDEAITDRPAVHLVASARGVDHAEEPTR